MAESVFFRTASFDSLLGQICKNVDKAEAADVIHELKRLYPTRKDSFDQTNLYGAFKQLYELGGIDDDGDQKLLEFLAEKTSENTKKILKLLTSYKEASSPRQDDFVGRDADVNNILKLMKNHRVPGVNLFGDSGVGKTTLAKEVSKKLEKDFQPVVIDLRGTKDLKTVYFKVLEMLKLTPWDYSKERIYTHLQDFKITKTLLILDNVEQFLTNENEIDQNRRKEFLEFLRTIMSSEASKRGSLKVILTSRIQIKDSMLDNICFSEYEVRPLTKEASRQMLSWRLNDETSDDQDIKALVEIVVLCRNTPYLLKGAEQLQRQNYSKPSKVLEKLNALKSKGVPDKYVCISLQFDSLPSDPLKQVAVKISLLQRPFSVSTAMEIADISLDYSAKLDLEMLVTHKILTAEDVNGERKYDLHALFREFVTSYLCNEDSVYEDAYEKAENQFAKHFFKIFTQLAKKLNKDFVGTYKELEEDKANLELFIDLATRKETLELILQSEDVEETGSVAILFEAFKSTKERRKLFGEWAKIMEKKGSWLSSANFRCWESIQLADMEGTQSACEALKRAEMSLAKAMLMLKPEKLKAAKGLCKYCSGRIKCMTSANLIDESSKVEKERLLRQALCDLNQSLAIHKEVYGDHTLTSRTLNLIGNCYMECGKPKEALMFHHRAMDMKIKLVGGEKHFDIPTYYNQLSQLYKTLGKEETSWSATYENYEKAAQYLEKASSLQEELGVNDTVHTATFQRNFANILIALEMYDQALEYLRKSSITNAHLGKHPEVVRILYLIGVIHELKGDYEAALGSYEEAFVMEESLPEDNHSVVRKRICDKLKGMCEDLDENGKLEEYGPKMEKIRKETDADAGKKPDADTDADARAGEGTDVIILDDKGGYYDFSSDFFSLEVPRNAVNTPVKVKYKVDPCRCQPPMAGITTSVSYFLELSSSKTVELNEPITMTLMHSGPGKEYGYTTTVISFNQDRDVWEELKEQESRGSTLGRCRKDYIRVQISKLTILAVVTRLITDRFQVTPKGCVVRSSVCDDVTIEFPQGAVDKTVRGTLKLLLMTQRKYLENDEYGYPCPILLVDGFEGVGLQKTVTIRMPHPCPAKCPVEKVNLMRLPSEPETILENKWEDITDQIIYKEIKTDQKCFVELQVQRFSWLWLLVPSVPLQMLQMIVRDLISSPPLFVRVGLFKAKNEHRRPVSMLQALKVTLACVANHDERHMREMKESHEELSIATSVSPLRQGDKALVKVGGDFKEKYQENEQKKVILVFLKDEKFVTEINVCRRKEDIQKENDRSRELIISLYKEIDNSFLCQLSTGETEGTRTLTSSDGVGASIVSKDVEFIKEKLGLRSGDNIDDFFGKYENFALDQPQHPVSLSELEKTIKLKRSIGAIIATNISNVRECGATCFRIGTKYVITNKHVINEISNLDIPLSSCHVDFNYKEEPDCCARFAASNPVLFSSDELDYAILELCSNDGEGFPPSVTELGFNIAPPGRQLRGGECLTFIGHPRDLKKQIDVSCPIVLQQDIRKQKEISENERNLYDNHLFMIQEAYDHPDRATYDVSTFFNGSSGSPGILMQKKLLVVLHSGGIPVQGTNKSHVLEYGTLISSVVRDVMHKIDNGTIQNVTHGLDDIFGGSTSSIFDQCSAPMDIDQD